MERTWGLYIELRTSKPFLSEWEKFFRTAVGSEALPTHFQYVSDVIFEELLKEEYKLTQSGDTGPAPLTFIEENALRYTVKNVVCPAHHFAVTPVEYMHTFKLSVAITPNYVVCMHTL